MANIMNASEILIAEIISSTLPEKKDFVNSFRWLNKMLKGTFGVEGFIHGAASTRSLLPNEPVEVTQLLSNKDSVQWSVQASHTICQESFANQENSEFTASQNSNRIVENVELSTVANFIDCTFTSVKFRVTANNISGLLLTAATQIFNSFIGNDSLFLRSLVQIKLWINFESKKHTYLHLSDLFNHDSLVVITMMVFVMSGEDGRRRINTPLDALLDFLDTFSTLNWEVQGVTATGLELKISLISSTSTASSSSSTTIATNTAFNYYNVGSADAGMDRRYPGPPMSSSEGGDSSSAKLLTSRNPIKEEVRRIMHHYRRIYTTHFLSDESALEGSGEGGVGGVGGFGSETDTSDGEAPQYYNTRPLQQQQPFLYKERLVMVMDPFDESRNICGAGASIFNRKSSVLQLQNIFSQGLQHFANISNPVSQYDLMMSSFPMSFSFLLSRQSDLATIDILGGEDKGITSAYNFICRNQSLPDSSGSGSGVGSGSSPPQVSDTSPAIRYPMQNTKDIDRVIAHAAHVSCRKVTEDSVINMVLQVLHQFDPMPIGEIGKKIQEMTQNKVDFSKFLRKRYGGLKKFIASHPERFRFGDNHNFNPFVYVLDPERDREAALAAPSSLPSPAPLSPRIVPPVATAAQSSAPQRPPNLQQQLYSNRGGSSGHLDYGYGMRHGSPVPIGPIQQTQSRRAEDFRLLSPAASHARFSEMDSFPNRNTRSADSPTFPSSAEHLVAHSMMGLSQGTQVLLARSQPFQQQQQQHQHQQLHNQQHQQQQQQQQYLNNSSSSSQAQAQAPQRRPNPRHDQYF